MKPNLDLNLYLKKLFLLDSLCEQLSTKCFEQARSFAGKFCSPVKLNKQLKPVELETASYSSTSTGRFNISP